MDMDRHCTPVQFQTKDKEPDLYPEWPDKRTLVKIINNIFGEVFVADRNGDVIFFSDAAVNVFHRSKEELLQTNVYDMVDRGLADIYPASAEVLDKREPIIKCVKNCSSKRVVSCRPVFDSQGKVEMAVVYSQDEEVLEKFVETVKRQRDLAEKAFQYLDKTQESNTDALTKSPKMQEIYSFAEKAAAANSTIIIYGESGTGKEVLARYIHKNSKRRCATFIPVNCAAIPPELMESEFFGYEKGAFTGASKSGKPGLFEIANGGTLFLDEIGELPLSLQSKLLRVLETGDIMRIGSNKVITTDVRIVAATNRNLYAMTKNGSFREDLYYRLHIIPINLPALRERKEDIEFLAGQFLSEFNKKYHSGKYFSPKLLQYFQEYSWPGNVRELKNVIERLVIVSPEQELYMDRDALFYHVGGPPAETEQAGESPPVAENPVFHFGTNYRQAVDAFEKAYIEEVIHLCDGNMTLAAKKLGLHRSSIYKKLNSTV